jgi:hypothetical protein
MSNVTRTSSLAVLLSTVAAAALSVGCSSSDSGRQVVTGSADATDKSTHALSAGSLKAVNGTYGAGCLDKSSGAWSVRISGSDPLDNAPLTVVTDNAACELTVTSLDADQKYMGDPTILMTTSYQSSASAFAPIVDGGAGALAFYANAKLSSASFASAFVVHILYSDDPNAAAFDNNATHSTVSSTALADQVVAPDYSATDNIAIKIDAQDLVTGISGSFDLTDGSHVGENYVIDLGTLPSNPTFADVDGVFSAGTPVSIASNPQIAGSSFLSIGDDLTNNVVRTLVIHHEESGVRSYQLFTITFKP